MASESIECRVKNNKEIVMRFDWTLDHDFEGEVCTESKVTEEIIRHRLSAFDGLKTFYCSLVHYPDESGLWCLGEPKRRIVEARLQEEKMAQVVLFHEANDSALVDLRIGPGSSSADVLHVSQDELCTQQEVVDIFLTFYRTRTIPAMYGRRRKSYVFHQDGL
jgi:hypothetical protein